jgi:hypothetical protein
MSMRLRETSAVMRLFSEDERSNCGYSSESTYSPRNLRMTRLDMSQPVLAGLVEVACPSLEMFLGKWKDLVWA